MRFASLGGSNAASYAAAGKAVADSSAAMFKKQRDTGPDYAGLSRIAMTAESAVKVAGTKAEGDVTRAAIKATGNAQIGKIKGEYLINKGEYENASRMAGILPAIGKVVGSVFKREPKRVPPSLIVTPVQPERIEYPTNPDAPTAPTPKPLIPYGSDTGASNAGSTSGGIPRTEISTGNKFSQPQLKQLLIDQGMPDADATIGAAIGMAESGGDPGIRSHPDLEARTGERSLGLWQHNANTGEDRHKFYGISDWSELKDPQTNARATYRLWQRRGGWGDWGAYTDGAYTKYLQGE